MRCINRSGLAAMLAILLISGPQFASAQSTTLDAVLAKTSSQLDSYLYRLARVRCTEQVEQQKLAPNGHTNYADSATYDYFILFHAGDDLQLQESRSELKPPRGAKKNIPLLLTNGFSNLLLIFHSHYRNSFRFDLEPSEEVDAASFLRVHFAYVPGMRTPAALAVRGREYPLHLAGTAWVDPSSGAIARIEATLADDMLDAGLRSLSARVDYVPIRLPGWTDEYRFPVMAVIDVATPRQHWRNEHRFSDYKRFVVDVKISMPQEELNK